MKARYILIYIRDYFTESLKQNVMFLACEGRSLTSNLKEADIIEVSLKGQLQLTTACNNTSNLTVFAEVFRADDWTEIALQVAFSEPDKIILV